MTIFNDKTHFGKPLRQVHFIDIDNLFGGPCTDFEMHLEMKEQYIKETSFSDEDLCFIACAHPAAFNVSLVWDSARVYWRSGKNGADKALIDALAMVDTKNFEHIWVASGDGCFIRKLKQISGSERNCMLSMVASYKEDVNREYFNFMNDVRVLKSEIRPKSLEKVA